MNERSLLEAKPGPSVAPCLLVAATVCAIASLPACGGAPPPAPAAAATATAQTPPEPLPPPEPEPIESGMDCAKATAECGGGVCLAAIDNQCEVPVTCEFGVMVACSSQAAAGQGKGKGRGTISAGAKGEISADAGCAGGSIELTVADGLTCR